MSKSSNQFIHHWFEGQTRSWEHWLICSGEPKWGCDRQGVCWVRLMERVGLPLWAVDPGIAQGPLSGLPPWNKNTIFNIRSAEERVLKIISIWLLMFLQRMLKNLIFQLISSQRDLMSAQAPRKAFSAWFPATPAFPYFMRLWELTHV